MLLPLSHRTQLVSMALRSANASSFLNVQCKAPHERYYGNTGPPAKKKLHGSSMCHLILPPNSRDLRLKNGWFTQLGNLKKCPLWKKETPFTNHPFSRFQPLLFQAAVESWIPPGLGSLHMIAVWWSVVIQKKQLWVQDLKLYSISIYVLPSIHV